MGPTWGPPGSCRPQVGPMLAPCQGIFSFLLQPENILCLTRTGNRIKIIDFGLAREYDPKGELRVLFGTPEFMAPEVVQFDPIDFATDMWSVGVICYVLWVFNRPVSQIPQCNCPISHLSVMSCGYSTDQSHKTFQFNCPISQYAPFCSRNIHICALLYCKMIHCGIFLLCIVGFVK